METFDEIYDYLANTPGKRPVLSVIPGLSQDVNKDVFEYGEFGKSVIRFTLRDVDEEAQRMLSSSNYIERGIGSVYHNNMFIQGSDGYYYINTQDTTYKVISMMCNDTNNIIREVLKYDYKEPKRTKLYKSIVKIINRIGDKCLDLRNRSELTPDKLDDSYKRCIDTLLSIVCHYCTLTESNSLTRNDANSIRKLFDLISKKYEDKL